MKVIKKDGREVTYSKTNISTAIMNANMRIGLDKRLSIDEIKKITADIDSKVREGTHTISTSDIQDLVERALSVNYDVLKEYIQENAKIIPARLTGTKAGYQRQLGVAIKRARFLALLPYTDNHH